MKKIIWLSSIFIMFLIGCIIFTSGDKSFLGRKEQGSQEIISFVYAAELEETESIRLAKNITKEEYNFNSRIIEYSNGTGRIRVGGPMYVDSNGTKIEDAKSLKNCEFCSRIGIIIQQDPKYPIEEKDIIDYNYTSITLNPRVSIDNLNKEIPIEIYSKVLVYDEEKEEFEKTKIINHSTSFNIQSTEENQTLTLPFGFGKVLKVGANSTNVTYNVSQNTDDMYESNTGGINDGDYLISDDENEWIGLRFLGVTIPAGATIDAAHFDGLIAADSFDEPYHTIYFQDLPAPPTFAIIIRNISDRVRTTAFALWDVADMGCAAGQYTSLCGTPGRPNLNGPIQELVDSYDYSGGSSMVMVMNGTAGGTRDLGFFSFNKGDGASVLDIEYSVAVDSLAPTFNETPANVTLEYTYDALDIDFNASDDYSVDFWWVNDTARFNITQDGELRNSTMMPVLPWHILISVNDTSNNINTSHYLATVTDTIAPTWNETPANVTLVYLEDSLNIDFNATDLSNISYWWVNDTGRFNITQSGELRNLTLMAQQEWHILVSVNDTYNNINTSSFLATTKNATKYLFKDKNGRNLFILPSNDEFTFLYGGNIGGDLEVDGDLNVTKNFTGNQIYGEAWYHNHTATSINFVVANKYYNLTFSNYTTNGFYNKTNMLVTEVSGLYQGNYHAIGSGINNHIYVTTIGVNGQPNNSTESHKQLTAGGDIITMSGTGFIRLTVGDEVTLMTLDDGDTGAGNYYGCNLNLVRIGD